MRRFGLIGYPLGHSFSKKYFSEKFLEEKIENCYYDLYPISSIDKLPDLIENENLEGLNVTIPYKSAVLSYLDIIDAEAQAVGAVNVIKVKKEEGEIILHGYNSDIKGLMDTLVPVINEEIKNALVLGTGGASKAVCYVLKKLSVNYTLISRIKKQDTIQYSEITSDILINNHLIINTTPLGMFPDINSKPDLEYKHIGKNHILFDLVYNPEITEFLKRGKERGSKIISGIKMLHSQAERSWEIWNDNLL
jgi:shikimate dehydrogenase